MRPRRRLDWYYEVFGPDNFFLELQSHDIPELTKINKSLLELGERYQGRFVATNDVHYVEQGDARWQDILLCVQTSSLISEPKRMRMSDDSYYLKSGQEMEALFRDVPGAISNTKLIADRCDVDLSTDGYILPEFEVPEGYTVKSYLRKLCDDGLHLRYGNYEDKPEIVERLEYELGIIDEMGFNAYFLIVWDLCRYSRDEGIWYNARGSAAGSIVAYSLDITLVDPMEHNLIFERFLNPGRVSMPDIDLDFQDDKRYLLMEYCAKKYGEDRVASIITFGKLKARAAVRDVGRVMDIPLSEVDRVAKLIPSLPLNMKIKEAIEAVPDLKQLYTQKDWVRDLLNTASELEGSIRNAGTHAAGVVITDAPIVEYIPLHRPTGNVEGSPIKTVTQFDMQTVDGLGLLKVDFLGLSTLTILQRACDMIRERHGVDLHLHNIPLDDEETFHQLGIGNTAGVFQLEGTGMTRWVKEMKPQDLSNVIAMVALYRPGPMEFIPSYIKRMHGEEEVEYTHEALKPILEETYGITVYQEQIMFTAMNLGGYTASEADFLRKSVAKKKEKELLKNREKFVAGAKENGIPEKAALKIFEDWEAFARYGFPKGHAADYAVISLETAYLKTHYPVEYMTALISVYQNDTDKVAYYVQDCQALGIEVLPPDVNYSKWDFSIEDDEEGNANIRFGMGAVKNVGHGPVDMLMEGRDGEPFEDLTDLANRVDLRKVGKRAMESLIKVGALDKFGPRMALLQVMDRAISVSASKFQAEELGQMSFFGADSGLVQKIKLPLVDPNYNRREQLNWERELVGLYVSDHPLNETAQKLEGIITHLSSQLAHEEDDSFVRVFGEVVRISKTITRKGDEMAFVRLEDIHGFNKLVVFPRTWKKFSPIIDYGRVIIAEGKLDNSKGEPNILVDNIRTEVPVDSHVLKKMEEAAVVGQDNFPPPFNEPAPVQSHVEQKPVVEKQPAAVLEKAASPEPPAAVVDKEPLAVPAEQDEPEDNDVQGMDVDIVDMPPEPEFPPDFVVYDEMGQQIVLDAKKAKKEPAEVQPEPVMAADQQAEYAVEEQALAEEPPVEEGGEPQSTAPASRPEAAGVGQAVSAEPAVERKPVLPIEDKKTVSAGKRHDKKEMVTIVMRSVGDKERDILRMRRVYGMLISDPGEDRFAFYVIEKDRGFRLEFPNDTTDLTEEMKRKIEELMGKENVIIEPITIQ